MDHHHTMRNDKISGFAWLCILLYDRIHIVKMTDFECRFCFLSRFHKVLSVCWFGWLFCFLFLLGFFCFRKTRLCDTICQTTSPKVKEDPPHLVSEVIGLKVSVCVRIFLDQVDKSYRHVTIPLLLPILT